MGFHNLTVNDLHFTVHFTLHRNEKTIGEKKNLFEEKKIVFFLFIAFYTSESFENQRVSFMKNDS